MAKALYLSGLNIHDEAGPCHTQPAFRALSFITERGYQVNIVKQIEKVPQMPTTYNSEILWDILKFPN